MKKFTLLSILGCMSLGMMAQTAVSDADLQNAYSSRTYSMRVCCHDPSVVVDDISNPNKPIYYIYGSHLGRGKTYQSSNYQNWATFKTGEENTGTNNSLFADVNGKAINFADAYSTQAVKKVKNYQGVEVDFPNFDAHGWQCATNDKGDANFPNTIQGMQWAPDVIYNKTMKKWCMYMSINGDFWCSSIVCLTSDNVEGPWVYQGPVITSGFSGRFPHNDGSKGDSWKETDLSIALGCTSLPDRYSVTSKDNWGNYWPNCIDPCVFYDEDDNLWMSYGSWSGGIYMIRLNKENGLRDYEYTFPYQIDGKDATLGAYNQACTSDPYFGKKIAGGYYVSGEASYIKKIGKYYFLFLSYGGLNPDGGYQMRVFRSEKADGPYKDCYGTSALYSNYVLNFGSGANDNRGVLLLCNYQWDTMPVAELAQGHNSAFNDDKGRSFVVYHTKFNDGSFGHEVRVHQLFLNDEGWLMAAPYEFDGETITSEKIASEASIGNDEIPGDYQFIRHQYNQNVAAKAYEKPVNIKLNADGTVSGGETGKWVRKDGTDYITLVLSGVTYRGALVKQTIDYTNIPALAIVALSSSSGSLNIGQNNFTYQQEVWAVKADAKAAIKYTLDKSTVPFQDGATLNSKPTLPTTAYLGTTVTWKSSDSSVMTDAGVVKGKGKVKMTMTISKDGYEYEKEYNLNIDADAEETTPIYYPESQTKTTDAGWWTNFSPYYELQAGKKMEFKFYNYSNMVANWNNWCLVAAQMKRDDAGYGADKEYFAIRNDNFGWGGSHNANGFTNDFDISNDWAVFRKDMNGALVDMTVSLDKNGAFKMESTITTTESKVYHYGYTTTLSTKPSKVVLFFVSQESYIDGSSLATGIENPIIVNKKQTDGQWYNLSGQQVDKSYKGVVIVNGKKFVNK